jgi:hypothetical protein
MRLFWLWFRRLFYVVSGSGFVVYFGNLAQTSDETFTWVCGFLVGVVLVETSFFVE